MRSRFPWIVLTSISPALLLTACSSSPPSADRAAAALPARSGNLGTTHLQVVPTALTRSTMSFNLIGDVPATERRQICSGATIDSPSGQLASCHWDHDAAGNAIGNLAFSTRSEPTTMLTITLHSSSSSLRLRWTAISLAGGHAG